MTAGTRQRAVDWVFVLDQTSRFVIPIVFVCSCLPLIRYYVVAPGRIFSDAHIYYLASAAWASGSNPWEANWAGIAFAAPPPALFLNLPLLPFGETFATAFWVTLDTAAVVLLIRRHQLAWWWWLFYPIFEGWSAASPDLVLAVLALVGGGSIAALIKPYSAPAIVGQKGWRPVLIAFCVGVATLPMLPWSQFIAHAREISGAVVDQGRPNSSWGNVPLMAISGLALCALRRTAAAQLVTPAILALQPHYSVFSVATIARSRILSVAVCVPYFGSAALGVVVLAVATSATRLRGVRTRDRDSKGRRALA